MIKLKVYDNANRLWKSKLLLEVDAKFELLKLDRIVGIKKAYWHENGIQKSVTLNKKENVPIFYTCSDGTRAFTIPINLKRYPIIANFADGRKEEICL